MIRLHDLRGLIVFRLENGSGHGDVRGGGDGNGDVRRFGGARPNCV